MTGFDSSNVFDACPPDQQHSLRSCRKCRGQASKTCSSTFKVKKNKINNVLSTGYEEKSYTLRGPKVEISVLRVMMPSASPRRIMTRRAENSTFGPCSVIYYLYLLTTHVYI